MQTWITKLSLTAMAMAAGLAQAESALQGRVTDPTGAPVAESTVILREEKGLATRATTGEQGGYRFDNLSAGQYTMRISKPGFQARQYVVRIAENDGEVVTLDGQFVMANAARAVQQQETGDAPSPSLRPLFMEAVKPKWSHVQLLGRFDFSKPAKLAAGSGSSASLWQAAAQDAYRRTPQLALVFGTTTQAPAAMGYRFRF